MDGVELAECFESARMVRRLKETRFTLSFSSAESFQFKGLLMDFRCQNASKRLELCVDSKRRPSRAELVQATICSLGAY